jgi:hypothetical protein
MIAMITRRLRAQWAREFTIDDAWVCVALLLPIGIAVVILGASS